MLHRVLLPQLGQTMEEGTIERWHKREGDRVEKGEVLFELTTDKATLEVEAFASGVVKKLLAEEGQTVPVNELIAIIGDPEEELPADLGALAQERESEAPEREAGSERAAAGLSQARAPAAPGRLSASPRARKIAREAHVPLEALTGSGPAGRIVERDVLDYIAALRGVKATAAAVRLAWEKGVNIVELARSLGGRRVRKADVAAAAAAPGKKAPAARNEPFSPMRRTIAERMAESKRTVPHFYLTGKVRMGAAMELRRRISEECGRKVTVTALLVKAVALALRQHPRVNARLDGDCVAFNQACNVGVAVAVEDGLFVPVIRDADRKGLPEIATELRSLADTAREGKLTPAQYEGGSITVSNLGRYGVDSFLPIVNPPEACIIGVGAVREAVVAENGAIRIEQVMALSLSADHRVVNGAEAAEFLATLRELLEEPSRLMD